MEPVIYLSGQIGLVPGSMELIKGGVETQSKLALRHVSRVIEVLCHDKLQEPEPLDQVIWVSLITKCLVLLERKLQPSPMLFREHAILSMKVTLRL